jgi:hypothetical protein
MSIFRKVTLSIWADKKFQKLSRPKPNAESLWFFFLVGPQTTSIPGLFPCSRAGICERFGWSKKSFDRVYRELSDAGMAKADWKAGVVFLPNALRHNPPRNRNSIKGWGKYWGLIPECNLKDEAEQHIRDCLSLKSQSIQSAFENIVRQDIPDDSEDHPENENQNSKSCSENKKQKAKSLSRNKKQNLKSCSGTQEQEQEQENRAGEYRNILLSNNENKEPKSEQSSVKKGQLDLNGDSPDEKKYKKYIKLSADIQTIWLAWREHKPHARAVLKSKQKEYIKLKKILSEGIFDRGKIIQAIRGYVNDDYWRDKEIELEFILRDSGKIERGIGLEVGQRTAKKLKRSDENGWSFDDDDGGEAGARANN